MFERMGEDVKIRSKCQWYEGGQKSTKFFFKFEKKIQSLKVLVRKLEVNGKKKL